MTLAFYLLVEKKQNRYSAGCEELKYLIKSKDFLFYKRKNYN